VTLSPQALHKRFTPVAAEFLREVLLGAVGQLVAAQPAAVPLLRRFAGVYVEDSTVVPLPDALRETFPGCGGNTPGAGLAAIKAHVRWELMTRATHRDGVPTGPATRQWVQRHRRPLPAGALRLPISGTSTSVC